MVGEQAFVDERNIVNVNWPGEIDVVIHPQEVRHNLARLPALEIGVCRGAGLGVGMFDEDRVRNCLSPNDINVIHAPNELLYAAERELDLILARACLEGINQVHGSAFLRCPCLVAITSGRGFHPGHRYRPRVRYLLGWSLRGVRQSP